MSSTIIKKQLLTNQNPGRWLTSTSTQVLMLCLGSAALVMAVPSTAAESWTGATSTDWFITGNWSPATLPTGVDNVFINTATPNPTVINAGNAFAASLITGNTVSSSGNLTISNASTLANDVTTLAFATSSTSAALVTGAGSAWNTGGSFIVGYDGAATLDVDSGGAVNSVTGFVGYATGSGIVTIDGSGSKWVNSGDLDAGLGGTASITVTNGALLSNDYGRIGASASGSGTVTIGTNSTWTNASDVTVGDQGVGFLNIFSGGTVTDVNATLALSAGSTGTANIAGTNSKWINSGNLTVGSLGSGTMIIAAGGVVSDVDGDIGASPGATGHVFIDGAGSTWTNAGNLFVGNGGTGTLAISNGGLATDITGYVGHDAGRSGAVTVDGAGSSWTTATALAVGFDGTGTLGISGGGSVGDDLAYIAENAGSTGTATVDGVGSTWTTATTLAVGYDGNGTLGITNGGKVTSDYTDIAFNAGSTGTVTVDGSGSSLAMTFRIEVGNNGTGALFITNGGSVTNDSAYVGDTVASSGTVSVNGAGSTWTSTSVLEIGYHGVGALAIANGGSVSDDTAYLGFYAGSTGTVTVDGTGSTLASVTDMFVGIAGTGTLTVSNLGKVIVPGSFGIATSAGSTGVLNIGADAGSAATGAGTITATKIQFGAGTGTINFNHTDTAYNFATQISGLGTINQIAGVTKLTGDSSGFGGTTDVSGGALYVNGPLGGTVNVLGGLLGGSGTIGDVSFGAGGTLAPGNSIGTLHVANATFAAGSTYAVELESGGTSDLIDATGSVTINGGTVAAIAYPDYALNTAYTIVTAAGGVTGTFDAATAFAFVGATLSYDLNDVYLTLNQTSNFAGIANTPNQKAAATGAESLGAGNSLYDAIFALPDAASAQAAFDAISGEIHASAKTAMIEDSRFLREAAMDRLRAALGDEMAAEHNDEAGSDGSTGVWGHGFGSFGQWDGDGNAATMTRNVGGVLVGADGVVGKDWRLGLIGGYSRSSIGVADRSSSGTSDDYHVGLYGGTQWGDLAFRSGLAYTWHNVSTSRSATFAGFSDTLSGDYGAGTAQAFGELGYRIKTNKVVFEPFANLAYVHQSTEAFTETGGAAALSALGSDSDAGFTTLGLRASTSFTLGESTTMTAHGSLGWRHAFGNVSTSTLAFAGGSAFTVAGVPTAQDIAQIGLGLDLKLTPATALGLTYDGAFGSGLVDQTLKGTLNVRF